MITIINESIKSVRRENEYIVFDVEEPYYFIELLDGYEKHYIHKHNIGDKQYYIMNGCLPMED